MHIGNPQTASCLDEAVALAGSEHTVLHATCKRAALSTLHACLSRHHQEHHAMVMSTLHLVVCGGSRGGSNPLKPLKPLHAAGQPCSGVRRQQRGINPLKALEPLACCGATQERGLHGADLGPEVAGGGGPRARDGAAPLQQREREGEGRDDARLERRRHAARDGVLRRARARLVQRGWGPPTQPDFDIAD